jgi:hypothetical protein
MATITEVEKLALDLPDSERAVLAAHLRQEAALGRREDLERFLAAVPDKEPEESDRVLDPSESA